MEICFSNRFNKNVVIITPTIKIQEGVGRHTKSVEINKILGWQHNAKFNDDLKEWEGIIFKNGSVISF